MVAYIVLSESLMYYIWDPWGVEYYSISDSVCFTGLAVTYAIVVCYLFKNLTRIQIIDGTLDKEKDEILHQFYVFELVFFTRALFSVGTYFLYSPQQQFILSLVYSCATIPLWDIIPIGYVLFIHKRMFIEMEQAVRGVSQLSFATHTLTSDLDSSFKYSVGRKASQYSDRLLDSNARLTMKRDTLTSVKKDLDDNDTVDFFHENTPDGTNDSVLMMAERVKSNQLLGT